MILSLNSIIFETLILMFVNIFYIYVVFLFLDNYFVKSVLIGNECKNYIYTCFSGIISIIHMIQMKYFFVYLLFFSIILVICLKNKIGLKNTFKILGLFCFITMIFNFLLRFLYVFYNVTQVIFIEKWIVHIIIIIFLKIFVGLILKLIKPYFDFLRYNKNLKNIYLITLILIPLFIGFIVGVAYNIEHNQMNVVGNIILFIFIMNTAFIINFIIVVLYLNYNQEIVTNAKFKINYYDELMIQFKKHIDEVKKLRHDFKNHILVMSVLMKDKRYEELSNYIKKMFYEEQIVISKLIITGNPAMDVIINNKLNKSIMLNIKVNTNIYVPHGLKIDEFELVVVLGNILDNAIEATCKLEDSMRYIKIFIRYYDKKTLTIFVSNTYDGKNRFLESKTSKEDKENHGIGLRNVEEVMKKNNGFFEIDCDDRFFKVKVMFYDVDQMDDKDKKV